MGCIVVTVLSDTDVVQVFPESGEDSGGAHVRARWHHTECVSESWHCIGVHMVCWFTEPVALMKSPSTGSLQCLLFYKDNAVCVYIGWKTRADPPTAACPEVWKLRFPEGKTSPGNPTGADEKGLLQLFYTLGNCRLGAERPVIFTLGCKIPQLW